MIHKKGVGSIPADGTKLKYMSDIKFSFGKLKGKPIDSATLEYLNEVIDTLDLRKLSRTEELAIHKRRDDLQLLSVFKKHGYAEYL